MSAIIPVVFTSNLSRAALNGVVRTHNDVRCDLPPAGDLAPYF